MNNVTPIHNKEAIQEEACAWISRIDRGLSNVEQTQLQDWVKRSEQHKNRLFEMAALWDDLSVMHELSGLFPLAEKISDPQVRNKYVGHKSSGNRLVATAASVGFLAAMLLAWLMTQTPHRVEEPLVNLPDVYQTTIGEQKTLSLPDGSVVSLNTNSRVEVAFQEDKREIFITQGEAHFEVASDANKPFIVSTTNNKVTAIGTAFNVQLLDDERFELLVTEGKVLVSDVAQRTPENIKALKHADFSAIGTLMTSGDTAVFSGEITESTSTLSLDEVQRNLSWQQGMLVFQGENLETALAEMSRYSGTSFEIMDDALRQKRVAGYFKVGDTSGLLHALENNFQITHEKIAGVIQLTSTEVL